MVNITILENALAQGAVCLDGSPAGYHYSEGFGDGANNWLVYLPGGGWCDTTSSCVNRVKTQPGLSSTINITTTYFGGILSPRKIHNPDFYNWNRVYVVYCDGSSFVGDVEAVDPETNLHYRGSRIFSAVVDELLAKGLNNAQNVILAGNSAGGLATILNCDRFRALVPNTATLKCVSDSGFFIRG
ncbi:protein notum homolog [Phtheirospermum japonicum]|uniref:Pectin acetylesterase n=1 Tax=Phtheirospermum japonicum TaxID=374723 RepID=A0A830BC29_9LAMI|nr:protein notum homolog [Phtheirospermum japonicum]